MLPPRRGTDTSTALDWCHNRRAISADQTFPPLPGPVPFQEMNTVVASQRPSQVPGPERPQDIDATPALQGEGMIRSEELLRVGTTTGAIERVRVGKHIITEEKTITVSVRREVFTFEREPISDADLGAEPGSGRVQDQPSQTQVEIVLHEEQIVVHKNVVPIERVTVITDLITAQHDVTEQVGKEQIETSTTPHDTPLGGQHH